MASKYLQPAAPALVAEAEFMDFAPAPIVCCAPLCPQSVKDRMYARVYENKLEWNVPVAPFCCFTTELCVVDRITTKYFDRAPARVGMCCFCIPAICCGPPVIFGKKPSCCCIDLTPFCGQMVMAAPCNYFGLKTCCIFGKPCYLEGAMPIIKGVKDSEKFVASFKTAVQAYATKNSIASKEIAVFKMVNDGFVQGSNKDAKGSPFEPEAMDR